MAWSRAQAFDAIAAYDFAGPGLNLSGGDRPEQIKGIHVSESYFRVFGATTEAGRTFSAQEDAPGGPRVAVIIARDCGPRASRVTRRSSDGRFP